MGSVSFFQATVQLHQMATSVDEAPAWHIDRLECIILDHVPQSLEEAAMILDVLIPEIEAGGRSDGRDVNALRNIRDMIAGQQPSL